MSTYRVDPDALRGLASRLDDTVAELGGAAAAAAGVLSAHGYAGSGSAVAARIDVAVRWCRAWSTSLRDRADAASDHSASFDRPTIVAADSLRLVVARYEYATLAPAAVTFDVWGAGAAERRAEAAELGGWLATGPRASDVHAALASLPDHMQFELAEFAPATVGSAPGVPVAMRIVANRLLLGEMERDLSAEIDALTTAAALSPWAVMAVAPDLVRLRADRAHVRDLMAPGRNVVFLDPENPRRVAEWIGPLGAGNVMVAAPGAAALSDPFAQMVVRANRMVRLDPTAGDLAVVVAHVYEPPPGLAAAATGGYAAVGGPQLAGFVAGIPLDGVHVTLVGHSYGSTVLGEALLGGLSEALPVDTDVVILGSPGVRTDTVTQLGVDADRVWVGLAPGDEIQVAISPTALPGVLTCLTFSGLLGACEPAEWLIHGRNPAHPDFGARVFDTAPTVPPEWLRHDEYFTSVWDEGTELASPALENLLHIATGDYPSVTLRP